MNLEDVEAYKPKPKITFDIRVSTCYWYSDGLHMRKDVRPLKRSTTPNVLEFFEMDATEGGCSNLFRKFADLEDGKYEVTIHEYIDWESGYCDDWEYTCKKYEN